ncbi:C-type lectin domain family 4 member K-like isoform X1 [Phascolarctos cinereus]|uniref:C-type lectin domain family 4 member K-like isoform X1 n=1 Tax=Phascolarctos cinereus TaxID=38626 RepID=A0A6P5LEJ8_PHACI|nr:C-type lectin domain family 4 member K-like isoform X1 [Phascolarctos cinereus]
MDQLQISENVTQENESHQAAKAYRILKAIHTALALLAIALAAALTVMTLLLLDLQGENDQLGKIQASSDALRAENKNLMRKVPEAWVVHNGSLYYFSCMDKSWEEAERSCVSFGSHLTSVISVEEQEFIHKKAGGSNYWIGLNILRSSNWRWTDGTHYNEDMSKDFWAPNEPNNKENSEHCVHFSKNRRQSWNDNNCSLPFLFICKWDCKSSGLCP